MENTQTQSLYGFETRDIDYRRSDRSGCHDIKQLWQRTHEILDLALQGWKQVDIARILGISPITVSNACNSTLGRQKLAKMREERDGRFIELSEEIKDLSDKAVMVYHEIMDAPSDDPSVSMKMKKDVADTIMLEFSGLRVPTKVDSRSLHVTATAEEIEEFKKRGIQAARESGLLVEVPGEKKYESKT